MPDFPDRTVHRSSGANDRGPGLRSRLFHPLLRATFPKAKIIATDVDPEMVKVARNQNGDDGSEYSAQAAADTIAGLSSRFADIVFVKSAYHYFEHEVTVDDVDRVLADGGLFVIAERTS